ncbi:balbiani ring protein 3-like [Paramacrobiotus metropolitanus]|uniref:balbiani ring protein 3-like n=1 Tax=Paramacrobiotus metropolitanus TaxID=2943436 RepID=UPI00244564F1|nr:balbiani ring protein 3-like [Paramacrobiotus metropolitanus]
MEYLWRCFQIRFFLYCALVCGYQSPTTFAGDVPVNPIDALKELALMSFDEVVQKYGTNAAIAPNEPQPLAVSLQIGSGRHYTRRPNDPGSGLFRMAEAISYYPGSQPVEEVPVAENPGCMPRETVIEMPNQNSAQVVYPAGTKVKRCTGVCGHSNLLCQSTSSRTVQRKGLILVYKSGKLSPSGYQTFNLTEDLSCGCRCSQSPDECKPNQKYEPSNCKCMCRNHDDSVMCGPHRVWDHVECKCKCPKTCRACVSGTQFDDYLCSCVPTGSRAVRPGRRN